MWFYIMEVIAVATFVMGDERLVIPSRICHDPCSEKGAIIDSEDATWPRLRLPITSEENA